MAVARFEQGVGVHFDGRDYVLNRRLDKTTWQLEDHRSKRIVEKTDEELRQMYDRRALTFVTRRNGSATGAGPNAGKAHAQIQPEALKVAKVRRAYVKAMRGAAGCTRRIREAIAEVWSQLKEPPTVPHLATVYRWHRRYVEAGRDIRGVVSRTDRKGNRSPRYMDDVVEIVEQAITKVYLSEERGTIKDTVDEAQANVNRENALRVASMKLQHPTRALVKRMVGEIPKFDVCVARYGREAAVKKFRSVQQHRTTERPLQRCEIDHTKMDLMVLDDRTGLPLGRPWLTLCIDDYSRCILGYYLGFEPPSHLSLARCLKHAFMPKTQLREEYPDLVNEWLAHGVPEEAGVDNGVEFHGISLEQAALELGMELHYAPRKTPWFKGKIERVQKTLNDEVAHPAPGTTFSDIFDKGDYDPLKHAVVRLSALRKMVVKWIVDVYHQRPHRTLKMPPAVAWDNAIDLDEIPVPEDPDRLDAILGRRHERSLSHKGIEFEGLFYNAPDLTKLRMELGDKLKVQISVDEGDIGSLIVFSPDQKRMFKALALSQAYANGLTAWQHKVCRQFAAKHMQQYDSSGWLAAKQRIGELIQKEFALKKRRSRSRVGRFQEGEVPQAAAAPPPPAVPSPCRPAPAPEAPSTAAAPPTTRQPTAPRRFAPVVRTRGASPEQP